MLLNTNHYLKAALFIASFFLTSCANKQREVPRDFSILIEIEQSAKGLPWKVNYQLSHPVTKLVFNRQSNRFRKQVFKSETEDVSLVEENDQEVIISKKPVKSVSLLVDPYFEDTPKDYEFFQKFSDGSVVVYTGHLNACPEHEKCEIPMRFKVTPRKNQKAIAAGIVHDESFEWVDEKGRGTYIYFGNLKPTVTQNVTALIDPALPKWMKNELGKLLRQLFKYYESKTGQSLAFKPFVFLNYQGNEPGLNRKGGTLPGLIQLSILGKDWKTKHKDAGVELARFLAHESAHLWNSQTVPYAGDDMWMHEGGADAFSYNALKDLKIISKSEYLEYYSDAFNSCIDRIKNRPLDKVTDDPNFSAHYRCGAIFNLVTERAIKNINPKLDLFDFWKELFNRAKNGNGKYSEQDYLSLLDEMSGNNKTSQFLKKMMYGPSKNYLEEYLAEFSRLGIRYAKNKSTSKSYNLKAGRDLVRILMKTDCDGSVSLYGSAEGYETEGMPKCNFFKTNKRITHIEGFPIKKSGSKSYESARLKCQNKAEKIKITANYKTESMACLKLIPEMNPYISFE